MKLNCESMKIALYELLLDNYKLKVTVKSGNLGCSDVQDACADDGVVILFKSGNNYMMNTISDDENILCVTDFDYIAMIVDTFDKL